MRPLLCLDDVSDMSLKDIDTAVEELSRAGYGGAVLPRTLSWEQLRGFCRSAARHGVIMWVEDDTSPLSGTGGGEITSVPEYAAAEMATVPTSELSDGDKVMCENGEIAIVVRRGSGLWGSDPFNKYAVEDFVDLSYGSLKRELGRFVGHELKGVVTRFSKRECYPFSAELFSVIKAEHAIDMETRANELFFGGDEGPGLRKLFVDTASREFVKGCLEPIKKACDGMGLELIGRSGAPLEGADSCADMSSAFVNLEGLSLALRQREIGRLLLNGAKRFALRCGLGPDFGEELWCKGIERLTELLEGTPEKLQTDNENIFAGKFKDETYFFVNMGESPNKCELAVGGEGTAYIVDFVGGRASAVNAGERLSFTLCAGGSLVLVCGRELKPDGICPPFTASGAVFAELSGEEAPLELTAYGDNSLPLGGEGGKYGFEAGYVDGNMYVEAQNATFVRVNGFSAQAPDFDVSGLVRMGRNVVETDGISPSLCGRFSTDGKSILPPKEVAVGDVRGQGLGFYGGALSYRVRLPENCGGKYLRLDGGFDCAAVKIGRRKEGLILPPFMLPLYSADEGRTAEVIIFPTNGRNDVPFGLNAVNIVSE